MTCVNRLTTKRVVLGLVALVKNPMRNAPRSDRALTLAAPGTSALARSMVTPR